MSDTPRTDAVLFDSGDEANPSMTPHSKGEWVPAAFARQLERELASEKRWKCDHCGAKTIDGCPVCGAPQCCPQCCKIDRLQRELAEADIHQEHADKVKAKRKYAGILQNSVEKIQNPQQPERVCEWTPWESGYGFNTACGMAYTVKRETCACGGRGKVKE